MKVVIIGLGVQGTKRKKFAGDDVVWTVDPVHPDADYKRIEDVPLNSYDAAICCIPDQPKYQILKYLIENKKNLLVEKPLWTPEIEQISELQALADAHQVYCAVAYNHRFEPHYVRMAQLIQSDTLGQIYTFRMFYGNGTARLVRESAWRDQGSGVLHDLGSHMLDTMLFFFGQTQKYENFFIERARSFENKSPDNVVFSCESNHMNLVFETSMLSWRNTFTCDVYAEKGSAHINSLCKWGPTTFSHYERILPSGVPPLDSYTIAEPDPTWAIEYDQFKKDCKKGKKTDFTRDIYIYRWLEELDSQRNLSSHRKIA